MGVIPLQFKDGESWQTLGLDGTETIDIEGVTEIAPRAMVTVKITRADGSVVNVETRCRIDTANELDYYKNGGILHYVLRSLAMARAATSKPVAASIRPTSSTTTRMAGFCITCCAASWRRKSRASRKRGLSYWAKFLCS